MNLEKIKQRDRWTCRRCGHKFSDLVVLRFGVGYEELDYITVCTSCFEWTLSHISEANELFKRSVRQNKIILIGDCHGNFERLDKILTSEYPFDFFISVGDIAESSDLAHHNISSIDKWKQKGYCVRGNHDEVECFTPLELVQELNGIRIASLNGMLKSRNFIKDSTNNISFREVMYLSHLRDVDMLVTHQPPSGLFNNIGEPVLEELLNYLVPRIYVFGHIHKFKWRFHLNTFMISLPLITKGYAVAYFQGKDLRNIEIIFKKGKKFIRV